MLCMWFFYGLQTRRISCREAFWVHRRSIHCRCSFSFSSPSIGRAVTWQPTSSTINIATSEEPITAAAVRWRPRFDDFDMTTTTCFFVHFVHPPIFSTRRGNAKVNKSRLLLSLSLSHSFSRISRSEIIVSVDEHAGLEQDTTENRTVDNMIYCRVVQSRDTSATRAMHPTGCGIAWRKTIGGNNRKHGSEYRESETSRPGRPWSLWSVDDQSSACQWSVTGYAAWRHARAGSIRRNY